MEEKDFKSKISGSSERLQKQEAANKQTVITVSTIISSILSIAELPEGERKNKEISNTIKSIVKYYITGKRHLYSDIFIALKDVQSNYDLHEKGLSEFLDAVDFVVKTLEEKLGEKEHILSLLEACNQEKTNVPDKQGKDCIAIEKEVALDYQYEQIYKSFLKFKDHMMLESARIKFWYSNQNKLEMQISELNTKYEKFNDISSQMEKSTDIAGKAIDKNKETMNEIKSFRTTQVTILTMFVAILLMLVTDIKFSTSVIEVANSMLFHKLILLIAFGGLVALNLGFALLLFISKIINTDMETDCKEHQCQTSSNLGSHRCIECEKDCGIFERLWKRYPYICIINAGLILVAIVCIVYYYNLYRIPGSVK